MSDATRKRAFLLAAAVVAGFVALVLAFAPRGYAPASPSSRAATAPKVVLGGTALPTRMQSATTPSVRANVPATASSRGVGPTARVFVNAYEAYQSGVADARTWSALDATATPALVAQLRSVQVAAGPRGSRRLVGRVRSMTIERSTPQSTTVGVAVHQPGGAAAGEQSMEVTLVRDGGRWLVTGLG